MKTILFADAEDWPAVVHHQASQLLSPPTHQREAQSLTEQLAWIVAGSWYSHLDSRARQHRLVGDPDEARLRHSSQARVRVRLHHA